MRSTQISDHIELFLGPDTQGGPDDLEAPIVGFINAAKARQKLKIAVQEIDRPAIAHAIIKARIRGVTIDLVVEQSYLLGKVKPKDLAAALTPGGAHEINRELFSAILRSTTDIKLDFNNDIFHQKFMIRGNSVLTGSTNFTTTGVTKNLNHVVIFHDAEVANAFKTEFREIAKGNFGKASVGRDDKPKEARVDGIRVKPLFAPDHGPEMEIMKQILKAQSRIDFAVFTFAKSSGIDDALIAADARGIELHGVLDKRMANQKWAAKHTLNAAGITLHLAGGQGSLGKLHHKLMVIDDHTTIFGSFNYTGPANSSNDENIVVVGDSEETDAAAIALQRKIALACRAEITRIKDDFGTVSAPTG